MHLPDSSPPQSLPPELNWRRVKVKPGLKNFPFILAGKPFGCDTHHPRHRTIPCFTKLPGCTLPCPYCKWQRRYTCWVPVIDPSNRKQPRMVVQGGRRTWLSVEGLEAGSVVAVSRGDKERDTPIFITAADDTFNRLTLLKWRAELPAEIRPWCFHLWQLRDLSTHFGVPFFPSIRTEEIERGLSTPEQDPPRVADVG